MKRSKYHSFEELPLMLNVQDVADVLGIGLAHAYEVAHRQDFPAITLGSRIMGLPPTGSARRESYEYAPTSRMTNTFFAPGTDDEEEMLATMGEGLFARRMGGGSVNPLTGEFNFAVLEGYWVRDGKILCPVRGASLIGRGAQVLMSIDRIGRHMWMGYGMCGSRSGSVPTNVGQPRIRVTGMTIGGKGGKL